MPGDEHQLGSAHDGYVTPPLRSCDMTFPSRKKFAPERRFAKEIRNFLALMSEPRGGDLTDCSYTAKEFAPRNGPRTNMFIAAILRWGEHRNPVRIRDMSPRGALIQSPVMPAQGTRVRLVRGSYSADGRVAWVDGNR